MFYSNFVILCLDEKWGHMSSVCFEILCSTVDNPDRAPLKEVLGGQYNYREGGGKCCGKALKAAGGVEVVDVIRIRAPKKWVAGARIQAKVQVEGTWDWIGHWSARRDVWKGR